MSEGSEHAPQRVIGRYALYGEIAAGGMATVHAGRLLGPVGFSRTVAIKRLHPQFAKDPEFVSMFLDEARVAARIQHPNVVSTLDVVALEGELFLVMEYVEGESLARVLRVLRHEKRPMPPKIAGTIVCNMLYGLHAAHEAKSERDEPLGIVHRDVSPQNVLVGVDGAARVLDFGVAKAAGRIQTTREGQVKGKIAYMPPEQLAGEKVDRRLDVYAASVVLWEMLASRRLFDGDNDGAVLQQVLTGVITPPSHIVEGLPAGVDEIVLKGLARNPNHRFQTAREMAVELEDVLGGEPPRKVAAFIQECAGDSIAKRAARIKLIESNSTDPGLDLAAPLVNESSASQARPAAPVAGLRISVADGDTHLSSVGTPYAPNRPRGLWVALAVLAVFGLLIMLAIVIVARSGKSSQASAPDASASNATGGSSRPSAESMTGSSAATRPSAPTPSATAPAASASSAPRQPTVQHTTGPQPARPPVSPVTPKGGCTPPFVIVDGIRKIKPECLK